MTKLAGAWQHDPEIRAKEVRCVTVWGMVVSLFLTGVKLVVGSLAGSQALVADGVHSFSDMGTDLALIVGSRWWSAPPDREHPHGHARIEILLAALIGVILALVGLGLGWRALVSIHTQHAAAPGLPVFFVACLSIALKEALFRWTVRVGRRVKSPALLANAWHHRSDALSSLPVALAVMGTQIWPQWTFLDHVAAILVSALILEAAWRISIPALHKLVDVGATEEELEKMVELVLRVKGVEAMHKLRTRYIGPGMQVDLHVLVDPGLSVGEGHAIAMTVRDRLLEQGPNVVDVLVHIEPFDAEHPEAETRTC